jgi:hypothetical protein
MIHLIQLYNYVDDKKLFLELFTDFTLNWAEELGDIGSAEYLIEDILDSRFGIEIACEKQLDHITKAIVGGKTKLLSSLPTL